MSVKQAILVVDDEPRMLAAISMVLEADGYRVLAARNGREAWETLSQLREIHEQLNLLVTDLLMPEMGGLELIDRIKRSWPETPVLVITGYDSEALHDALLSQGHLRYLKKPFRPQTLLDQVAGLLAPAGEPATAG